MQAFTGDEFIISKLKHMLVAYMGQIRSLDSSLPDYQEKCKMELKKYKINVLFHFSNMIRRIMDLGASHGMSLRCLDFLLLLYLDFQNMKMKEEETIVRDSSDREDIVSKSSIDPENVFVDSGSEKSKGSLKNGSEKSFDPDRAELKNEVMKDFTEIMHAVQILHNECFLKMASTFHLDDGYFDKKLLDLEKLVGLMKDYYAVVQPLIMNVDK